jgi:hypothetical protein
MSEIRNWLEAIGLGQSADAFDANPILPFRSSRWRSATDKSRQLP